MLKREDIRIRDPYIVLENGVYYMYATTGERTLSCYTSTDLENFEGPFAVFEISENSWAYKDVWAAEVHKYKDRFYLFVSLLGRDQLRGTQIAVSDTPKGPFIPLVNRPVTPRDQSCIDGTLYVDDGVPYIVYSHDWPDNYIEHRNAYVGQIVAAQLDDELVSIVGEPFLLFDSDQSPISAATPHHIEYQGKKCVRYGSDAPFLRKLSNGRLFMSWSPYLDGNYVVLGVISESGSIRGPWRHLEYPIFDQNGGHAMMFEDLAGRLCMCIHAPERHMLERAHIFTLEEREEALVIAEEI